MNNWEVIVLTGFHSLGGEADLRQLYGYLENSVPLRPHHLQVTKYGGRPAYQHQVRSHVINLYQTCDLQRTARGRYALTKKGRSRLQQVANTLAR